MNSSAQNLNINPADYQMPEFLDYASARNPQSHDAMYGLFGSINNFITGEPTRYRDDYNRQQSILDRKYELDLENTKFQRAFRDIENAGYNPWLMLQNGGIGSAANMQPSSGASMKKDDKKSSSNLGMFAMAAAKLLAILAA